MGREVVFLLEEPSMKAFLEGLLPRIAPAIRFILVPHEGRHDLVKSFPRKIRAWRTPGVRFVIVHDQDSADCVELKRSLQAAVPLERRNDTSIRIACRELESWLLGDLDALAEAFDQPDLADLGVKRKFRQPDNVGNPGEELSKLVPFYQKVRGARQMGRLLEPSRNTSHSFGIFLSTLHNLSGEAPEESSC